MANPPRRGGSVTAAGEEAPVEPAVAPPVVNKDSSFAGAVIYIVTEYIPKAITQVTISLLLIMMLIISVFLAYQLLTGRIYFPGVPRAEAISNNKMISREVLIDLKNSCAQPTPPSTTFSCSIKPLISNSKDVTDALSRQNLKPDDVVVIPVSVNNCLQFGGCQIAPIIVTIDGNAGALLISKNPWPPAPPGTPPGTPPLVQLRLQLLFIPVS